MGANLGRRGPTRPGGSASKAAESQFDDRATYRFLTPNLSSRLDVARTQLARELELAQVQAESRIRLAQAQAAALVAAARAEALGAAPTPTRFAELPTGDPAIADRAPSNPFAIRIVPDHGHTKTKGTPERESGGRKGFRRLLHADIILPMVAVLIIVVILFAWIG